MHLYTLAIFLITFSVHSCFADSRLGWSFWLNPNRPSITGPVHVEDYVSLSPSDPNVSTKEPLVVAPSTSKPVHQSAAVSATRPIPNAAVGEKIQCGTPKVGFYDPFGLSDLNMGVWTDPAEPAMAHYKNKLSMALTIIGGQDTDPEKICWQVKLHKDNKTSCGGSIIGKRTILTASHCVNDFRSAKVMSPDRFRVVVGAPFSDTFLAYNASTKDAGGCAQWFNVTKIIPHPEFIRLTNEQDLALVILSSDIDFNRNCVCPVCLSHTKPKVGEMCTVSGYGLEEEYAGLAVLLQAFGIRSPALIPAGALPLPAKPESRSPRPLKFVRINIKRTAKDDNCYIQEIGGKKPNLNNFICAGDVKGEDTCQGDSGGPVVCMDPVTHRHYQSGIVSYGKGCGRGVGGMYTRVSSFLDWIKENADGDILGLID